MSQGGCHVRLLACCAPKYRQGAQKPKGTGRSLSGWGAHHFAVVRLVAEHLGRHVPVGARLPGHVVAPGRRALHARAQAAAGAAAAAAAAVPALRLILQVWQGPAGSAMWVGQCSLRIWGFRDPGALNHDTVDFSAAETVRRSCRSATPAPKALARQHTCRWA